jgi:hypothetical protein
MNKLLELENSNGAAIIIDAHSIIAIEKNFNIEGVTNIYCNGIPNPFAAKITHLKLLDKLEEIGMAELIKF